MTREKRDKSDGSQFETARDKSGRYGTMVRYDRPSLKGHVCLGWMDGCTCRQGQTCLDRPPGLECRGRRRGTPADPDSIVCIILYRRSCSGSCRLEYCIAFQGMPVTSFAGGRSQVMRRYVYGLRAAVQCLELPIRTWSVTRNRVGMHSVNLTATMQSNQITTLREWRSSPLPGPIGRTTSCTCWMYRLALPTPLQVCSLGT